MTVGKYPNHQHLQTVQHPFPLVHLQHHYHLQFHHYYCLLKNKNIFIDIIAKNISRKLYIKYGSGSDTDGCNPSGGEKHFELSVTIGTGDILQAEHPLMHCKAVITFFH